MADRSDVTARSDSSGELVNASDDGRAVPATPPLDLNDGTTTPIENSPVTPAQPAIVKDHTHAGDTEATKTTKGKDTPEMAAALLADGASPPPVATVNHDADDATRLLTGPIDPEQPLADLGWHAASKDDLPTPVLHSLPNEDLWALIRRFNSQVFAVRALPEDNLAPGALDMHAAEDQEFSPDRLRATLERLYMTVVVSLAGGGKHVARLRSWNEKKRSTAFCVAYFTAWIFNYTIPLLMGLVFVLLAFPRARRVLFPHAPLALISAKTGGLQTPIAGSLGSKDSLTGAPEAHKGEAVEREASQFVNGLASIAVSSAVDKGQEDEVDDKIPDVTNVAEVGKEAAKTAAGEKPEHDKTKAPVQNAMWKSMGPILVILGDIADTWERFGNALNPTRPFPRRAPRAKLASIVLPAFLGSLFIKADWVVRGSTFAIGFAFFGDPLIQRGIVFLNEHIEDWQKLLEIRHTVLKGVPTNAQLSLTLLRLAEAQKAPLPPPPAPTLPEHKPQAVHADVAEGLDVDHSELAAHASGEMETAEQAQERRGSTDDASSTTGSGKKKSKFVGFLKVTARAGVASVLGADKLKAVAGHDASKRRLGVVNPKQKAPDGPSFFNARYQGKKGHAIISNAATTPCLNYSRKKKTDGKEELEPVWSVLLEDIVEIRKNPGLGWKSRIVVGWALQREIADGLEIKDKRGDSFKLTAMQRRDELFNRLIALGGKKWEMI